MSAAPVRSSARRVVAAATGLALLASPALLVPAAAAAAPVPADAPTVVVTEIVADNAPAPGASAHPDNFEYVEVHNTTSATLDLAAEGISFAYSYVDTPDRTRDVPLTAEPLVLAAGETAVLWVSYTASGVDSFAFDLDDFRAWHSVAPDTQVVRVTGQPGIANGGDRGIRVIDDGELVSWSHAPAGAYGHDLAAHFRMPADAAEIGLDVLSVSAPRSPGTVLPEALVRPAPEPEPEPQPEPGGTDAAAWPLLVTEIAPDNAGVDEFEYVEVHNPTGETIDLQGGGYAFAYTYANGNPPVPLTVEAPTSIAAGETVVLWLSYTATGIDSFARSDAEFRAMWGMGAETRVIRVTGQPGMANGGGRGIQITRDGVEVSSSLYPAGSVAAGRTAHFRIPGDTARTAMEVLAGPADPSPGTVEREALTFPAFDPQPDPSVVAAPLQVTELLPDSANIGGSDAYEFIEVYNATSEPIDFSDYTLNYLYPDTGTSALWPAVPADVVIPGGRTLVFWIKNGANDALGEADFDAAFGVDLELGVDLVEISSAGMANGSARGIEVMTNTGHTVSRAYYNRTVGEDGAVIDDTRADQGIRYVTAAGDDLTNQRILDIRPATPGTVQRDQVPAGLAVVPADVVAPVLTDRTPAEATVGSDFVIEVAATDDVDVRTLTLTLANSADDVPLRVDLVDAGEGVYRYTVNAADLTGKRWYDFSVVASDGTNEATLETRRVPVAGADLAPVRLNVTDGQFVSGTVPVIAGGDRFPSEVELSIGDEVVETAPSLEGQPVFAFEATGVDYYFKNGVRIGEDVLTVFDRGIYEGSETIVTPVPLEYTAPGDDLTVSIWTGTKRAPEIDLRENNDDFTAWDVRLILPDGRTLRPVGYDDPAFRLPMGDSVNDAGAPTGRIDFYDARFVLPDDAFSAARAEWDTTANADGPAAVTAVAGEDALTRTVSVDNTAPVVTSAIRETYQGPIDVAAEVVDTGAGVASVTATLDGAEIALENAPGSPSYTYATSSVDLSAGEHELAITATDALGNADTWSATFLTYEEQPSAGALAPLEGAEVEAGDVTLQARVEDPTGDQLDVSFLEGRRLDLADGDIEVRSGTVNDARDLDRTASDVLGQAELRTLGAVDGLSTEVTSDAEFPYQLFDVAVGEVEPGAQVRATWSGRANAAATVILFAQRADGTGWTEVDRHVATADDEDFELSAVVDVEAHAVDGVVRMLVQHSEGFAGENLSDRSSAVAPHNPGDLPRSEFDFTIAWESDTQYYNENTLPGEPYRHQQAIHSYLLERREALNLQYLFHTGDVIDDWDVREQWDRADPEYRRLDEAGLPYGVLAGNHDVGNHLEDYTNFGAYFGADRYAGNPWYGGDFENNRGHYDLVSAGGIDFLMLYTGWLPGDASIAWMNEVLARYPDRVAILAQHEFLLETGGLGQIPQRVFDEVVVPNTNVRMVLSGHYHDAFTRTDAIDDTGDGVADRTVTSMLFDYQGLPEGGLGFLRLMQFDNEGERMLVRTYSPSLDRYNSDDPSLVDAPQEFEISYDQLGIEPLVRTLGTDAFSAEVLTASEIASFEDVASGSILTATWPLAEVGERGWYVRTSDPYGAVDSSPVVLFSVTAVEEQPGDGEGDPGEGGPGGGAGAGEGGPGGGDGDAADPAGDAGSGAGGAPISAGGPDRGGALPSTGTDAAATIPWIFAGAGLLVTGAGLVLLRRRVGRN